MQVISPAINLQNKILIVTRNFPPLVGGMERLTFRTYEALSSDYSCGLIGPTGCSEYARPETPIAECHPKPLARFLLDAWVRTRRMADLLRPGLILAASGLTAPFAEAAARRHGAAVVTVVHGLDLVVANRIYQRVFVPAIRRSQLVIANSANTAQLAARAGIAPEKIEVLHPGVALPATAERGNETSRAATGFRDRRVLLSVGRLVPRKGLAEFIAYALPEIVRREPRALLVIAGSEGAHALKRYGSVLAKVRTAVVKHKLQNHVRILGAITNDSMLNQLYSNADVFVMPLVAYPNDVEGFGMVAVEAAAHGLPTVGFASGGLPDAVRNGVSGILVAPGDYNRLAEVILTVLNSPHSTGISGTSCRDFASRFSWEIYGARLREICSKLL